ncbi:MAG: helix-turn-helix transcriptional regulator [Candidatus Micrarchaeota archaeon]|nr:helix-turn-helix transcriptional regulator [Candidatus Micrarchaeota archaeon]
MTKTFETKKKILNLLKKREMTLSELSRELNLSTATVSQHLEELHKVGAVEKINNEYFKKMKYYKTNEDANPMVLKYVLGAIAIILAGSILLFSNHSVANMPTTSPVTTSTQANYNNTNSQGNQTNIAGTVPTGAFACPLLFYTLNGSIAAYNGFTPYSLRSSYGMNYTDYVTSKSNSSIYAVEVISGVLNESQSMYERQHYAVFMPVNRTLPTSAVSYTLAPINFTVKNNSTVNVTLTLHLNSTSSGTYWVRIDGPCAGGVQPFLITIGNKPYNGTVTAPIATYA